MNFPTLSEYNQTIAKYNGAILNTLKDFEFIPSRTIPFKMYQYGAGTFAGVFKAQNNNLKYAIRCFITSEEETLIRYKYISNYLNTLDTKWQVDFEYLENEINIDGKSYPVIKMEWVDGELINEFVSNNISNKPKISTLQEQLISLSDSLEKNKIGHGDLQSGNIIIQDLGSSIRIRLIDYDGVFVPALESKLNIEKGRPEFQHPQRNKYNYNSRIDRFSIWVMITALEAIKYDSKLWNEVNLGGFNTGDNFLFVANDFIDPHNSQLFKRLSNLKAPSLNFYLQKLKLFSSDEFTKIDKPELSIISKANESNELKIASEAKTIDILSDMRADVYNSVWVKLGTTPLNLPKEEYVDKIIYVQHLSEYKKFIVKDHDFSLKANFIKSPFADAPFVGSEEAKKILIASNTNTTPTNNKQTDPNIWGWVIGFIILMVFVAILSQSNNKSTKFEEAVDSTAAIVDSAATVIDNPVAYNEFGNGNGKVSFYTNFLESDIEIYVDGMYSGKLDNYFENAVPNCGQEGTIPIILSPGKHKITAKDDSGKWAFDIFITEGKCLNQLLNNSDLKKLINKQLDEQQTVEDLTNEKIVNRCKLFLSYLNDSKCSQAFKQTNNPNWELKGLNWFCSSSAYGGVNSVTDIELSLISNDNYKATVHAKYYANDKYNGPNWYDQIFELERYDDDSWLIIKVNNN